MHYVCLEIVNRLACWRKHLTFSWTGILTDNLHSRFSFLKKISLTLFRPSSKPRYFSKFSEKKQIIEIKGNFHLKRAIFSTPIGRTWWLKTMFYSEWSICAINTTYSLKESSIWYMHKIFGKTSISYPLIDTSTRAY